MYKQLDEEGGVNKAVNEISASIDFPPMRDTLEGILVKEPDDPLSGNDHISRLHGMVPVMNQLRR